MARSLMNAIGKVTNASASVEESLRYLICALMESDMGHVLYAGEDMSVLIRTCLRLDSYVLDDERSERMRQILTIAGHLREQRNVVVHTHWERHDLNGPGWYMGVKRRRSPEKREIKRRESVVELSADRAHEIADELEGLVGAIYSLCADIGDIYSPPLSLHEVTELNKILASFSPRKPRVYLDAPDRSTGRLPLQED
ncbi:hypothetical protein MU582_20550 [Nocardioidaceae bacterium SCSIO 66511]|nr:hypothetical protein MU582_20550 [Nocardioidaceae bacterium SCSIO 66511]